MWFLAWIFEASMWFKTGRVVQAFGSGPTRERKTRIVCIDQVGQSKDLLTGKQDKKERQSGRDDVENACVSGRLRRDIRLVDLR